MRYGLIFAFFSRVKIQLQRPGFGTPQRGDEGGNFYQHCSGVSN